MVILLYNIHNYELIYTQGSIDCYKMINTPDCPIEMYHKMQDRRSRMQHNKNKMSASTIWQQCKINADYRVKTTALLFS
jgi:hypothetical protein